jgi:hypothetical protein
MSTSAVIPSAESAPVTEVEVQEVTVQDRLDHATGKELDHWRATGEIPAVKIKEPEPKPAESAPATEAPKKSEAKPADAPPAKSETAAAPPAAPPQKPETRSERRFREITRENRELRERLEAVERRTTSQPAAEPAKAESQPAKAEPAKLAAKPKLTDNDPKTGKPFASLEAWSDAVDEWNEKRLEAKLEERLGKAEQARTMSEELRQKGEQLLAKSKSAMEKYADFREVVGVEGAGLPIPAGSPADQFIDESDHPGEVLYYLVKHPEVVGEFYGCTYDPDAKNWDYGTYDLKTQKYENKISPVRQIKILEAIEREVIAEKKPAVAEPAAPAKPQPPKLPPPPTELDGRRAASGDDAEKALARGDVATYMRLKNKEDLAASRR